MIYVYCWWLSDFITNISIKISVLHAEIMVLIFVNLATENKVSVYSRYQFVNKIRIMQFKVRTQLDAYNHTIFIK